MCTGKAVAAQRIAPPTYADRKLLASLLVMGDAAHDARGFKHTVYDNQDGTRFDTVNPSREPSVWLCGIQVPMRMTPHYDLMHSSLFQSY